MENIKEKVKIEFKKSFDKESDFIFSSGGRFEIIGNHTDHNHGLCLAATCNLCITAAVSKRDDNIVNFFSFGYKPVTISLNNLEHVHGLESSSEMIKGIAHYFKEKGYKYGGFDAYTYSTIFAGAGVSSSAAFELLIAQIFNELYNDKAVPTIEMCKAGQYSENYFYEKNSGLLDQIGVGFGNIVSIDFKNIKEPIINNIEFPFEDLHFVIVNTGGSHANLNSYYSAVPQDMLNAAKKLGHEFLREGTIEEINNCKTLSDIEKSRAEHFYGENDRVKIAIDALKNKDKDLFLKMINESRKSSTTLLKNMMVDDQYIGSPLEACDLAMKAMKDKGAAKINGGGFAGSIICVVPCEELNNFIKLMANKYGENNVCEVFVRTNGPIIEEGRK